MASANVCHLVVEKKSVMVRRKKTQVNIQASCTLGKLVALLAAVWAWERVANFQTSFPNLCMCVAVFINPEFNVSGVALGARFGNLWTYFQATKCNFLVATIFDRLPYMLYRSVIMHVFKMRCFSRVRCIAPRGNFKLN